MIELIKNYFKKFDWFLFFVMLLLVVIGLHLVYVSTFQEFGLSLFKSQLMAAILGVLIGLVILFLDYDYLERFYKPLYGLMIFLLVAVLIFGTRNKGAKSWIIIKNFISFQPSEICKLIYIICLAKLMSSYKETLSRVSTFAKIFALGILPILLILMENDLGTSLVYIFIFAVMIFIAGLDLKYFLIGILTAIITLPLFWNFLGNIQRNRLLDFFDPTRDIKGTGYQAFQSKVAIGSGQFWGRGLADARLVNYGYLPFKYNDFIFSVAGEVYGFIGAFAILFLLTLLILRLIRQAKNTASDFQKLTITGIIAMILYHIIQNIGMTIGLMPVTGIPLPFISQGGTSLIINIISVFLILGIGMRQKKYMFES